MFTILKQQFRDYIARFVYNFLRTGYDLEHWTRTISCSACRKPVAINGQFCTYCGWPVGSAASVASVTPMTSSPPVTIGTEDLNTAEASQNSELINLEPVTILFPQQTVKRHFLNYVRTQREQVGPATQAHRIFQDYGQRR